MQITTEKHLVVSVLYTMNSLSASIEPVSQSCKQDCAIKWIRSCWKCYCRWKRRPYWPRAYVLAALFLLWLNIDSHFNHPARLDSYNTDGNLVLWAGKNCAYYFSTTQTRVHRKKAFSVKAHDKTWYTTTHMGQSSGSLEILHFNRNVL